MKNVSCRFNNFVNSLLPGVNYDFKDKDNCINQHVLYMLNRTQSMFKYSDLPESIPERVLELFLQTNGNVCFYNYNGTLRVFTGGIGGEPDIYYRPTIYTISNPRISKSITAKIGIDCVVMLNDTLAVGMLPLYARYASALTETELSLQVANINSRIIGLISASDDATKCSADEYIKKIVDGELSIVGENAFLDGVKVQPMVGAASNNAIINLIELEQYLKASWYNEIGLNANYNMKRESLNSAESKLNNDVLLPLVDDMLKCREIGIEKVNKMFGTNIKVSLNSSWKDIETGISAQSENGGNV